MTFRVRTRAPATAGPVPATGVILPATDFAAATELDLRIAVTLSPFSRDAGGVVDIRLADQGFTTEPDDTPAHTHFEGRLLAASVSRQASGASFGGRGTLRSGSVVFGMADRALRVGSRTYDTRSLFSRLAIAGRAVEIRLVDGRYADGIVVFSGRADEWRLSTDGRIEVPLRGFDRLLDQPLQPATYAGTGGREGPESITGQRKPVLLGGPVEGVQPVLLDGGLLVYDIHNDAAGNGAPIAGVDAAFIGGVALTVDASFSDYDALLAASQGQAGSDIPPGTLGVSLSDGYCRLGAEATSAVFTIRARGATVSGVLASRPGELIRTAVTEYGPRLSASMLSEPSLNTVDSIASYTLGRFFGPQSTATTLSFLDEIMRDIEGGYTETIDGRLRVFVVTPPGPVARDVFGSAQVMQPGVEQLSPPRDFSPAAKEVTIGFARNYTVIPDPAELVDPANAVLFQQPWQTATRSQSVPQHPEARSVRRDTNIVLRADAEDLASRLLALADGNSRLVRWPTTHKGMLVPLGSTVSVTAEQDALDGDPVRLLGIEFSVARMNIRLLGLIRNANDDVPETPIAPYSAPPA